MLIRWVLVRPNGSHSRDKHSNSLSLDVARQSREQFTGDIRRLSVQRSNVMIPLPPGQTTADGLRLEYLAERSAYHPLEFVPSVADAPPIGVDAGRRDGAAWVRLCHGGDVNPLLLNSLPFREA